MEAKKTPRRVIVTKTLDFHSHLKPEDAPNIWRTPGVSLLVDTPEEEILLQKEYDSLAEMASCLADDDRENLVTKGMRKIILDINEKIHMFEMTGSEECPNCKQKTPPQILENSAWEYHIEWDGKCSLRKTIIITVEDK